MFLGFGEVMLRINPPGRSRFRQSMPGGMQVSFGGGEFNVCASLAGFGRKARFVTALPVSPLTDCLRANLRQLGVDGEHVAWTGEGRLGLYFFEAGANQRSSVVVYDREGSAIALTPPEAYAFERALDGVEWVHVTGITPALSRNAFLATRELVRLAAARGITVSCDLNFRKKLWRWEAGTSSNALAQRCLTEILPFARIVVANEEDAQDVLGIAAEGTAVEEGQVDPAAYERVAREIVRRFPGVRTVAVTLRQSFSADDNAWGGLLFDAAVGRTLLAPVAPDGAYRPYRIRDIVDRVGGGDAFAAGLIHALTSDKLRAPETALRFAVAAGCLKHSVPGDVNLASEDEVSALMSGAVSGRVRR